MYALLVFALFRSHAHHPKCTIVNRQFRGNHIFPFPSCIHWNIRLKPWNILNQVNELSKHICFSFSKRALRSIDCFIYFGLFPLLLLLIFNSDKVDSHEKSRVSLAFDCIDSFDELNSKRNPSIDGSFFSVYFDNIAWFKDWQCLKWQLLFACCTIKLPLCNINKRKSNNFKQSPPWRQERLKMSGRQKHTHTNIKQLTSTATNGKSEFEERQDEAK